MGEHRGAGGVAVAAANRLEDPPGLRQAVAERAGMLGRAGDGGTGSERAAAEGRLDVRDDLLAHAHRPPHEGAEPAHPATPVGRTI
jgi:hypothetical protein